MGGDAVILREPTRSAVGVFHRSTLGARARVEMTDFGSPQYLDGFLPAEEMFDFIVDNPSHGLGKCISTTPQDPAFCRYSNIFPGVGTAHAWFLYRGMSGGDGYYDLTDTFDGTDFTGAPVALDAGCVSVVGRFAYPGPTGPTPGQAYLFSNDPPSGGVLMARDLPLTTAIGGGQRTPEHGAFLIGAFPSVQESPVDQTFNNVNASTLGLNDIIGYPRVTGPVAPFWDRISTVWTPTPTSGNVALVSVTDGERWAAAIIVSEVISGDAVQLVVNLEVTNVATAPVATTMTWNFT